jgi:putative transposase
MKDCTSLRLKQIFTRFNNPKGNADTERMMRTMKEALIWSNEFESFEQLSLRWMSGLKIIMPTI